MNKNINNTKLYFPIWQRYISFFSRVPNNECPSISMIAKELDTTYSHIHIITRLLERDGFVTMEKVGRRRVIRLTDVGKTLFNVLTELFKIYEKQKQ